MIRILLLMTPVRGLTSWLLCVLLPLLVLSGCAGPRTTPKPTFTTVYIVRHAEKDLAPGLQDPPLTPAGQQRAQALRDTLLRRPVAAIYSTTTLRTQSTAQPLAQARRLTILPYDARQLPQLVRRIRQEKPGQAVLVVGHSNTILETVEALGAPRPVPAVQDNEYDYLLEVRLPQDSTQVVTAVARRYGVSEK